METPQLQRKQMKQKQQDMPASILEKTINSYYSSHRNNHFIDIKSKLN